MAADSVSWLKYTQEYQQIVETVRSCRSVGTLIKNTNSTLKV